MHFECMSMILDKYGKLDANTSFEFMIKYKINFLNRGDM